MLLKRQCFQRDSCQSKVSSDIADAVHAVQVMQERASLRYGFRSISTALLGACAAAGEKGQCLPSSQSNHCGFAVGEELSQSLARPESIGVLACEALRLNLSRFPRRTSLAQMLRAQGICAHSTCKDNMRITLRARCGRPPCRGAPDTSGGTPRRARTSAPAPPASQWAARTGPRS